MNECAKQLAAALGRHVNYVYAMRSLGFGGKSLAAARAWVRRHGFVIRRGRPCLKYEQKG